MVAGAIATAFVDVRPDTSGFGPSLQRDVTAEGAKVGRSLAGAIGGALVTAGVGRGLLASLREFDEAAKVQGQTAAAIRSTGAAANVTAEDVGRLSDRISDQIAVDDELIQRSANLLLTFTKVRNEVGAGNDIFDRSVAITQDMAAALGTDAAGAALQLGKALNDPISGISALRRAGVQLTQEQKDQIAVFVESGDILSAQKVILQELETQVGGSAEAQATGLDRLTVATGNMKEAIGESIAPAAEFAATLSEKVLGAVEALPDPLQTAVVAGGALVAVLGPLGRSIEGFRSIRSVFAATETAANVTSMGAAATNSAAGFNNLYASANRAGKSVSTLASIGKGGLVIGGIVAAAVGLERIVNGADEAGRSLSELGELADRELLRTLDAAAVGAELFGESTEGFFRKLADESFGTLIRYRDLLRDAGRDTTELDEIIRETGRGQAQANRDMDAGSEAVDRFGGAASGAQGAVSNLGGEVKTLADRFDDARTAIEDAFGLLSSVEQAEADFRDTIRGAFDEAHSLLAGDADAVERRDAFQQFLLDARDDAITLADALGREGVGSDEIVNRFQTLIDSAAALGDDFGLTDEQVLALRDSLGLLPGQIELIVETNLDAVQQDLLDTLELFNELAGTGPVNVPVSLGGVVRDSGGGVGNPAATQNVTINVQSPSQDRAGESVVRELRRESVLTAPGGVTRG